MRVLEEVVIKLGEPGTSVDWPYFESPEAAREEAASLLDRVRARDPAVLFELKVLFAPAAALQDVSINSGWAERSLKLTQESRRRVGRRRSPT